MNSRRPISKTLESCTDRNLATVQGRFSWGHDDHSYLILFERRRRPSPSSAAVGLALGFLAWPCGHFADYEPGYFVHFAAAPRKMTAGPDILIAGPDILTQSNPQNNQRAFVLALLHFAASNPQNDSGLHIAKRCGPFCELSCLGICAT